MEPKSWISLGTLSVSIFAAWAAFDARNVAHELKQQQFRSETTIELLSSVFEEISEPTNEQQAATSCIFVEILGRAEEEARDKPPYFVRNFIDQVDDAGLWDSDCQTRLEALSKSMPESTPVNDQVSNEGTFDISELGTWHALIASYPVSSAGCQNAKDDVREFSALLSGQIESGVYLYVARTKISNNYAVTVDAGDDRSLALSYSRAIQSIADRSADGLTGADSFVQGNREWFIDPDCTEIEEL